MVKRIFDFNSQRFFNLRPSIESVIGAIEYSRVEVVADRTPQTR